VLSLALIWLAHIGFDRALGYGLKYAAGFGFTHLGRIGKEARAETPAQSSSSFETARSLSSGRASRGPVGASSG
jgi:hypothetical protein